LEFLSPGAGLEKRIFRASDKGFNQGALPFDQQALTAFLFLYSSRDW